jgi:hypothetical protein
MRQSIKLLQMIGLILLAAGLVWFIAMFLHDSQETSNVLTTLALTSCYIGGAILLGASAARMIED